MAWLLVSGLALSDGERIQEALARAGQRLQRIDQETPEGSGVVFFTSPDEYLHKKLQELSRRGRRVLAVATAPRALDGTASWALLRAGASDVLLWDWTAQAAYAIATRLQRWCAIDEIIASPTVSENLVGQSDAWLKVLRQCVELGRFTNASVLITGETGTGKELVARLIHTLDPRTKKGDLIVVDCTTIVSELSGSEFFGHERGAFTGAAGPRDGAFALADGGTLFLDEAGELAPKLQAQLLRVIQEQAYKRVGGNEWKQTRFRLICATNRDLVTEVQEGRFRSDLYYRIAASVCRLPPLRERLEDVAPLAETFILQLSPNQTRVLLTSEVRDYLLRREYPGNVRDLKQLISRIMCRHMGSGAITVGEIPEDERPQTEIQATWLDEHFERAIQRAVSLGAGLKEIGSAAEDLAVKVAMASEDGNLRRAAQKLGVTDRALQMRRAAARQGPQFYEPAS